MPKNDKITEKPEKITKNPPKPAKSANITQKLDQLKTQIDWFYSDDFDLAEATQNYQAAIQLSLDIENDLQAMKNDITALTQDFSN